MDMNDVEESQPRKRRKTSKKAVGPPEVKPLLQGSSRTLRPSGRSAHIVFLDESSVQRALQSPSKPRPWTSDSETPSGLAHYLSSYDLLRPPLEVVRDHADSAIELYEYQLAKTKAQRGEYRKGEAIVDEDGFTLVTRGGAYGQSVGGGVAVASKLFEKTGEASRNNKKKEKKEKANFYAFQKAEKQRAGECFHCRFFLGMVMLIRCNRNTQPQAKMGGRQGENRKTQSVSTVQAVLKVLLDSLLLHTRLYICTLIHSYIGQLLHSCRDTI